jgi:hypothetical protein
MPSKYVACFFPEALTVVVCEVAVCRKISFWAKSPRHWLRKGRRLSYFICALATSILERICPSHIRVKITGQFGTQ